MRYSLRSLLGRHFTARRGGPSLRVMQLEDREVPAVTFTSPMSFTVDEDTTTVGTMVATTDKTTVTYTLSGIDAALFQLDDKTGELTFLSPPDFEFPLDSDGDNKYALTITATDDEPSTSNQRITVTVANVAPGTPTDADPAADTVPENATTGTTVGITAAATDSAGGTIKYALIDDAGGRFQIDSTTGVVTVKNATLLDGPTTPNITVEASDGTLSSTQTFTIGVTNVAPTAGAVAGPVNRNEAQPGTYSIDTPNEVPADLATLKYSFALSLAGLAPDYDSASSTNSFTFTPTDGPDTVQVFGKVYDQDDGKSNTPFLTIDVADVGPVVAYQNTFDPFAIQSVDEGAVFTLPIDAVNDPGTDNIVSYTINWGDGSSDTFPGATFGDKTHVYADGGPTPPGTSRTISVTVENEDGTFTGLGLVSVVVNNVPPTISAAALSPTKTDQGVVTSVRNAPVNFQFSKIVDPAGVNDEKYTVAVDFDGNGTVDKTFTNVAFTDTLTQDFKYTQAGSFTLKATVTDDDGGSTFVTLPVRIVTIALDDVGNLLVGGTPGNNKFDFRPGGTKGTIDISIDGAYQGPFAPAPGKAVRVFGGDGQDAITIFGTGLDDLFEISAAVTPDLERDTKFALNGREYSTRNVETFRLDGGNGSDTFTVIGTNRVVTIEGNTGGDKLVLAYEDAAAATVTVTGLNKGSAVVGGSVGEGQPGNGLPVNFNGIETVVGTEQDDLFVYNTGAYLQGGIDARAGDDDLTFENMTAGLFIVLQPDGKVGSPFGGPAVGIENLIGSQAGDIINGAALDSNWTFDGTNTGFVTALANAWKFTFESFENVTGGSKQDVFIFDGGNATGKLDGGGSTTGPDTFDYSALNTPVTVNLGTRTASLTGGWNAITKFIGGTGDNTLTGANVANTWTLSGKNDGTVNTISFVDFGNLVGGTGPDQFQFAVPVATIKSINGGGSDNTLTYAALPGPITVTLVGTNTGTGSQFLGGGFMNITNLIGSAGADTLIGPNGLNSWLVLGADQGKLNSLPGLTFSSIENLDGGTGADTFAFANSGSKLTSVSGGAGIDTVAGANIANTFDITAPDAGTLGTTAFDGVENVQGGAASDLVFLNGGSISGTVNGGTGTTDTLKSAVATNVDLAAGTATGTGGIAGFENFVAVGGTVTGPNLANVWLLTGLDKFTLNAINNFTGFATVNGGSNDDRVQINGGRLTGAFNAGGQASKDVLDYAGVTLKRPITVPLGGPVPTILGPMAVSGFEAVVNNT